MYEKQVLRKQRRVNGLGQRGQTFITDYYCYYGYQIMPFVPVQERNVPLTLSNVISSYS